MTHLKPDITQVNLHYQLHLIYNVTSFYCTYFHVPLASGLFLYTVNDWNGATLLFIANHSLKTSITASDLNHSNMLVLCIKQASKQASKQPTNATNPNNPANPTKPNPFSMYLNGPIPSNIESHLSHTAREGTFGLGRQTYSIAATTTIHCFVCLEQKNGQKQDASKCHANGYRLAYFQIVVE